MQRLSRLSYFMGITELVAGRSTCLRRQVGAVIVTPDYNIVSTGYNGPPSKHPHCVTCLKGDQPSGCGLDLCPAIHAEANAILRAARAGISTADCTVYCTLEPCLDCLKLCVNAGIERIIFKNMYQPTRSALYDGIVQSSGILLIGPRNPNA